MSVAIFAGSFDPPSYGHLNIIERAKEIFTEVHVVVALNPNKSSLFSGEERVDMISTLVQSWNKVTVVSWSDLIVNYAKKVHASVLIRGVRNVADFGYEFDLALINKGLAPKIETVFLVPDPKYFILRSSSIKEVAEFGGNLSTMVPPLVEHKLIERFHPHPPKNKT